MMEDPTLTLDELDSYAQSLWNTIAPGAVLWLSGDLGSGKTTFTQALVRAAGGDGRAAHSPSYALVHQYDTPWGIIVHADCYRLNHPTEALDLDLVDAARNALVTVIEWPEQGMPHIPSPDCHLRFEHQDAPDVRKVCRII